MKKSIFMLALIASLFSVTANAQDTKPKQKKKAKTEKSCTTEEKKECNKEKKGSCCAAKKAKA